MPFPQHDFPTHKRKFYNLTFGRAREYSRATHDLTPFSPTPTPFDTTSIFTTLHPKSNGYFTFFFEDYEPD
jgi:hypothetical protein